MLQTVPNCLFLQSGFVSLSVSVSSKAASLSLALCLWLSLCMCIPPFLRMPKELIRSNPKQNPSNPKQNKTKQSNPIQSDRIGSRRVGSGSSTPLRSGAMSAAAFEELGICGELVTGVDSQGWAIPTPIQAECVPLVLGGGDVLAAAETGE